MGFLKRLFSVGGKKNKKQRSPAADDVPPPLPVQHLPVIRAMDDEEHEAAIGRLLRSSSARYTEASELDYATLPPIPHPINRVIQTPASSTISLASSSISQRGTYNVTVHKRRRHASTEFPLANRDLEAELPVTRHERTSLLPVEDSRVLRLRSDPSVASLLELYDEHGKLADDAFSNNISSPPKEGRAQCRRSGSTLRQLLGATSGSSTRGGDDNSEGDISWAERFLAGSEATSSNSSLGLHTPRTPQDQFPEEYTKPEISFMTDGDLSLVSFDNPAISSMEVEINNSQDISQELEDQFKKNNPYMSADPSTPQRASQVFGFLTTKGKQSRPPGDMDRTLPDLPSCFSSPSDEGGAETGIHQLPDDSMDFSFAPTRFSAIPMPLIDNTPRHTRTHPNLIENTPIPGTRMSQEPRSAFSDDSHDYQVVPQQHMRIPQEHTPNHQPLEAQVEKHNDIKVLMSGPTKVIVTAPTPSTNPDHNAPSRLPRGPRAPPRKNSSGSTKRRRSVLGEVVSNSASTAAGDPFVIVTPRQKTHRRNSTASVESSSSRRSHDIHNNYSLNNKKTAVVSPTAGQHKENQLGLSVKNVLPLTPLRTHSTTGSRSLFRTVVSQSMFNAPAPVVASPNSSSEMSPVGRQIMTDVRQQRMRAREVERVKASNRF